MLEIRNLSGALYLFLEKKSLSADSADRAMSNAPSKVNFSSCRSFFWVDESMMPATNLSHIELDKKITLDEIKAVIKTLWDGKAAGPDNIPKELLKKLPIPILEKLKTIFNKIMITNKYPEIWTNSIIHPIFKNGDRNNPSDYRGIALCSKMSKLFTSILRNRLNNWIEKKDYIGENQEGFRKKPLMSRPYFYPEYPYPTIFKKETW
ncbi:hypothetical protein LAZ67_3001177 [Cordylochernes scorpioides]|uniref:Reverse transcriptase domain-containing protein n=1 Tax=Cordylochernes scorpioides TaxID=51811 RepID=A0ABY6K6Q1_9ARAC|nr:hypothetical protein LAZ67_3001177 [Cordylochernes scorpioides]